MTVFHPIWTALFPDLRHLPHDERAMRLARAANTDFDWVERVCIGGGTAWVAWAVSGPAGASPWDRVPMLVWQFGAAMVPLALILGAVHWRRLRRGLDSWHSPGDDHE